MKEEKYGEIWFALWVWPFLVICLNDFPLLWVGEIVAGSEGLLASPPGQGWALNMPDCGGMDIVGKAQHSGVCQKQEQAKT